MYTFRIAILSKLFFFTLQVKSLKGIGGHSMTHAVANILKRVMSNNLAEMYSWAGAKQNMAFKKLKFSKAVLGNETSIHFYL